MKKYILTFAIFVFLIPTTYSIYGLLAAIVMLLLFFIVMWILNLLDSLFLGINLAQRLLKFFKK